MIQQEPDPHSRIRFFLQRYILRLFRFLLTGGRFLLRLQFFLVLHVFGPVGIGRHSIDDARIDPVERLFPLLLV